MGLLLQQASSCLLCICHLMSSLIHAVTLRDLSPFTVHKERRGRFVLCCSVVLSLTETLCDTLMGAVTVDVINGEKC